MDLKQLNYFVTVVAEGNISKASRKLHIAQPPLSNQLRLLEKELNCTLFERGSRSIELTEPGRLLYQRALNLLELADVTKKELKDYQTGANGTLRFGVVSSVVGTLLSDWIFSFRQSHPDIAFELFEANTYELLDQMKSNLIELAIVRTPFSDHSFECMPLKEERLLAVGHKKYFNDCKPTPVSLRDLENVPLITYRRWNPILLDIFSSESITPNVFCNNDDAKTTALWADAGLGIGIIPASSTSLLKNQDTLIKHIDDERFYSQIMVIRNKNGYHSLIAKTFFEFLKGAVY